MLYLINCLFIITKVQCEENKIWTTPVIIHFGFTPKDRVVKKEFQGTKIFLPLSVLIQLGIEPRNGPMN